MASNNDAITQWPPASPKDVLRLTPKKPLTNPHHSSPLRRATAVSPSPRSRRPLPADEDEDSDATTSDEDEEALQLQLKAIEMKLKLKRLQKEKKRKALAAAAAGNGGNSNPISSQQSGRVTPPPPPSRPAFEPDVQVPVSPSPRKKMMPISDTNPPQSPSRVLLGIDKGLRARDISLKRAPGMTNLIAEPPRKPQFTSSTSSALHNITKDNPFAPKSSRSTITPAAPVEQVKTFSERIAEQRAGITAKEARARENEKLRSKGWNVDSSDAASTVSSTMGTDSATLAPSRAPSVASHRPSSSQQNIGSRLQPPRSTSTASTVVAAEPPKPSGSSSISGPSDPMSVGQEPSDLGAGFDSFSSLHLSRRSIPHTTLSRHLQEKELFQLPRLLKTVHSPEYDPPDVPGDWVVFGIVSSKSEPRDVAREGGGKYIVMQLTDLKWELDLFFFGSTFQKYYRIPVGTVLAILNPNIMKPRNQDSGKFSLTLSDSNDDASSILEIGHSRDLGACKARKRDGKECGVWVDKRRTEYCDFHVEQTVAKNRAGRMEYLKANLEDEGKVVMGGQRAMENAGKSIGKGQTVQEVRSKALEEFRKGMAAVKASDVSLSPVKSKRKAADRKSGSPEAGPGKMGGTDDERAVKRTRKADEGPVGWAQRDVKKHLERNAALTTGGGLKQTRLEFGRANSRSRSRSKSPPKGDGAMGYEREASPTKSNIKSVAGGGRPRRDSKTVTFAPTPDRGVVDDDSDDDLEILGM